jgi:hypothetical protein
MLHLEEESPPADLQILLNILISGFTVVIPIVKADVIPVREPGQS